MYDKKNTMLIGVLALAFLGIAGLWYLLGDREPAGDGRINVERGLEATEREQRNAGASIERIRARLADSAGSLDRIEQGTERGAAGADRIRGASESAAGAIGNAERTAESIARGTDDLAERSRATIERIDRAEERNCTAETALDGVEQRIRECGECLAESERILAKYTHRISEERTGARPQGKATEE